MSAKSRLRKHLEGVLHSGESIELITVGGVMAAGENQTARDIAANLGKSVAASVATGGTAMVIYEPRTAWAVVTSHRLLVVERLNLGKELGELLLDAPRDALTAALERGLLTRVTVAFRSDRRPICRFDFGVRKGAARKLESALCA